MTATERLRAMLDERGVEWRSDSENITFWNTDADVAAASQGYDGMLWVSARLTPEQAIAATLGRVMLTAEQVHDAIFNGSTYASYDGVKYYADGIHMQEIADELNTTLGSNAKPCYAADANYERCKYSVNRGWCDDAPFLVWDDTGHLFITMGGLKTWDVTDDAKKWFATLDTGTCRWEYPQGANGWLGYMVCSGCGEKFDECVTDIAHYCPNCGRRVEQ